MLLVPENATGALFNVKRTHAIPVGIEHRGLVCRCFLQTLKSFHSLLGLDFELLRVKRALLPVLRTRWLKSLLGL